MKYINKSNFCAWTAIVAILSLAACSKKTDPSPVSAANTFTIRGNTYTIATSKTSTIPTNGSSNDTNFQLETIGVAGTTAVQRKGDIVFIFNRTARPTAGSYFIVPLNLTANSAGVGVNQIGILALDSLNIKTQGFFTSATTSAVSAKVSLSTAGKITIDLPSSPLTGDNFDNTDPNNTVITTLNTTISGSFTEQ